MRISDWSSDVCSSDLSTGIETSPTVGLIFPELDRNEWGKFRAHMPEEVSLGERFEDWIAEREEAISQGTLLKPLVPMAVTFDGRSEERRVGKECVCPCRYRGSA